MTFKPVVDNPDLSIHPDPPKPGVAIACRWKDAHRYRARHPDVSVVGPLRTVRGIDLLFRSLLANPQISHVYLEGVDLTPNQATTEAVFATWQGDNRWLGEDVIPHADLVRQTVEIAELDTKKTVLRRIEALPLMDQPQRRFLVLPPPAPEASSTAPHGDPGHRVVGNVLDQLWPRALQQAMHFGRAVPTQYGETREVLNLVSVIRNPASAHILPSWIQGHEQVGEYAARLFIDLEPPEGAKYSYSSRLHDQADGKQISRFHAMLDNNPSTRAAYITPWNASQDAGLESGRPCMVGVWFRQVDGELHMTVMFRSHDLFGAYPLNLASAALFLQHVARVHRMKVGTLTCVSCSAHVYDRDYVDAERIIMERIPKQIGWDPRSTWRVELVDSRLRATALSPDGAEITAVFEGKTPEGVRAKIERSGLIQSVGNALWLGSELERVAKILPVQRLALKNAETTTVGLTWETVDKKGHFLTSHPSDNRVLVSWTWSGDWWIYECNKEGYPIYNEDGTWKKLIDQPFVRLEDAQAWVVENIPPR